MKHNARASLLVAGLAAAALWAAAAAPAQALPGPAAVADAYLRARAAAVTATDPAAVLGRWILPGTGLKATETTVARGAALRAADLRHLIDSVDGEAVVTDMVTGAGGASATVWAHVVTTIAWHAPDGGCSVEASGVDHVVTLARSGDSWLVTADAYEDEQVPSYLAAAGATARSVRAATRRLESRVRRPLTTAVVGRAGHLPPRGYADVLVYDRDACKAYADKYAISYNPTYVRFSADCADFASQSARAGGMPVNFGVYSSGWWYDRHGTSSPADDAYSLSWINVPKQMGYWNARRTDWASSITDLSRGDFVYYDWSGDGSWDHVAVVAGLNSAGQRVVDAHTTDLYRVFWKLGSSATHYKFARVRAQWVIS